MQIVPRIVEIYETEVLQHRSKLLFSTEDRFEHSADCVKSFRIVQQYFKSLQNSFNIFPNLLQSRFNMQQEIWPTENASKADDHKIQLLSLPLC